MGPDHQFRMFAGLRDLGDAEGRGIGGEDGVIGAQGGDFLEDALLEVHDLRDGLDDEVRMLDGLFEIDEERHPAEDIFLGGLGHAALVDAVVIDGIQRVLAALEELVLDVPALDLVAGFGGEGGDLRPHGTGPEYGNVLHLLHGSTPFRRWFVRADPIS